MSDAALQVGAEQAVAHVAERAKSRAKRRVLTPGRLGLLAFLLVSAAFFALPLYVMLVTSLKPMAEIRLGDILALPREPSLAPWIAAWSEACTGRTCEGIGGGFWNSVRITVPSVVLTIALAAVNGYALTFWRPRGGDVLLALLLFGTFIPYQLFIYPLVRMFASVGLFGTLPGIVLVHILFGLPIITLLFRNYYASLPPELFRAARIDGGRFWSIFFWLVLPMSGPILVVALILEVTGVWNDFLFGLVFAGRDNLPMTVQLNNVVATTTGERFYNVEMAATLLTGLLPLAVYFLSGRWFVRGVTAGAVKG